MLEYVFGFSNSINNRIRSIINQYIFALYDKYYTSRLQNDLLVYHLKCNSFILHPSGIIFTLNMYFIMIFNFNNAKIVFNIRAVLHIS